MNEAMTQSEKEKLFTKTAHTLFKKWFSTLSVKHVLISCTDNCTVCVFTDKNDDTSYLVYSPESETKENGHDSCFSDDRR